ncbi:hypothetical protein OPQ81_008323 [Rhizoctonia solani]|nr:hypothetical protein OPQ81_008323 [Rhizoctonia solani]
MGCQVHDLIEQIYILIVKSSGQGCCFQPAPPLRDLLTQPQVNRHPRGAPFYSMFSKSIDTMFSPKVQDV